MQLVCSGLASLYSFFQSEDLNYQKPAGAEHPSVSIPVRTHVTFGSACYG